MSSLKSLAAAAADVEQPVCSTQSSNDEELEGIGLLRSVDFSTIKPLLCNCPIRTLRPTEVLIAAGRPNNCLYVVLSGRLSVRLCSAETAPIAEIVAGETAGELSMIDRQPTSAYVVAETDCRVLVIDEELLWMLVNTSHAISTNLLYTLTKRLRVGNNTLFENRERLEQYRYHATVDALTGLFNRHWLSNMLPRQMHRSRICDEPFSLLLIDIDRFKDYNDLHGHVAGDCAIATIGKTLRDTVRPSDMVARYGGEEFLVLLPNCPREAATGVAERLRSAVERTKVNLQHGPELPSVTVSIGVAAMPKEGTMESFVTDTDAAMYRAKEAGRNRVSL